MASLQDDIEQGLILDTEKDGAEVIRRYIRKYRESFGPNARRNIARSNKWFMRRVARDTSLSKDRAFQQLRSTSRRRSTKDKAIIGRLMMFKYSAKHADTLPVWDANPLVFFFGSFVGDGVYGENGMLYLQGLNVHYLPPALRLKLFTSLLKFNTDTGLRDKSKLKLSWQILKAFSQSGLAQHAVKMYRVDHLKSELIEISPRFWEIVLFLNLQDWQKGSNNLAWKGAGKRK